MKPHLEIWTYNPSTEEVADGQGTPLTKRLDASDGRLISAAPDMARALMAVLEREPTSDLSFMIGDGTVEDMRSALRKAGVLT